MTKISKKRKILLGAIIFFILSGFLFSLNIKKISAGSGLDVLDGDGAGASTVGQPGAWDEWVKEFVADKIKNITLSVVGIATQVFISVMGTVVALVVWAIDMVLKYDGYTTEAGVIAGWAVVRDFSNMFFILILLIIAFATVLRVESYNYKRWLPKLIIMAILINFSLLICKEIIAFSQVIVKFFIGDMIDFQGQLVNTLGIQKFLDAVASNKEKLDFFNVVVAYLLAVLFLAIALVVLAVFLFVLVTRLIMLWLYVILSPLAYLLASFPEGQKYSSRWWSDFSQQVITGPLLAFFLWLSIKIITTTPPISLNNLSIGNTKITTSVEFTQFIMAIGMLLGGLKITAELGGITGSIAGGGMRRLNQGKGFVTDLSKRGAIKTAKWTGRQTLGLARGADRVVAQKLRGSKWQGGGVVGTALQGAKYVVTGGFISKRNQAKIEADKALHEYHRKKTKAESKLKEGKALVNSGKEAEGKKLIKEAKDALRALRLNYNGKQYRQDSQGRFFQVDKNRNPVNKEGKIARKKSERVYAKRDSFVGKKDLLAMGAASAAMFMGRASASSAAWAAAKAAQDEKVAKDMKKIEAANMTPEMMMEEIRAGSTSGTKKMALAITMAIKDGFKGMTHKDVADAKKRLGSNQLLLKKFNDEIDKKFAHLNYDLNTREGRETFKKRLAAGKIDDVMHESAYKDPRVLEAIREQKGDKEFYDYMSRVTKASKAHRDAAVKGMEKNLSNTPLLTPDGDIDPRRMVIVKTTGDLGAGFKNIREGDKDKLADAMKEMLAGMSNKQLAQIDPDSLDMSKALPKYSSNVTEQERYEQALRDAIDSEVRNNLAGIKKAGASNKLMRAYENLSS